MMITVSSDELKGMLPIGHMLCAWGGNDEKYSYFYATYIAIIYRLSSLSLLLYHRMVRVTEV